MATPKQFTREFTLNAYGNPIVIYGPFDAKFSITGILDSDGSIGWVKAKTASGPGNDNALNIPTEWLGLMAEIYKDIVKYNRNVKSKL